MADDRLPNGLDPDSFLEKFSDLTHEKLSIKLKELLENERDEIKRIVN